MTRLLLLLISCATLFAQRTPLKINGAVVDNPNFTNSASLTWTIVGSTITGTAAGGGSGASIWTNDNGTISATSTNSSSGKGFLMNVTGSFNLLVISNNATEVLTLSTNSTLAVNQEIGGFSSSINVNNTNGSYSVMSGSGEIEGFVAGGSGIIIDPGTGAWFTNVTIAATLDAGSTFPLLLQPDAPDGTTPYVNDTSIAHTSGNLMEVKNNGTNIYQFGYGGQFIITSIDGTAGMTVTEPFGGYLDAQAGYFDVAGISGLGYGQWFPDANDSGFVMLVDSSVLHTSGPIAEFINHSEATKRVMVMWDGSVDATGGFSSSATDAAVTIASTGWTNTFGKNAVVYLDGIGLTFKVANSAGTFVYTNSVALAGDSVLLQPSGKIIITGGTLGVGRATPF